jgi:AcrR family transcriptional regulator
VASAETTNPDPRVVETRRVVLDEALRILLTDGVHALTYQRVARNLGIARTTIYRHWPTRAHLLFDAFDHGRDPVEPIPSGPLGERLRYVLDMFHHRLTHSPLADTILSVFAEARADPELNDLTERLNQRLNRPLREVLEEGIESGDLCPEFDVDTAVAQLVGPISWRRHVLGGAFNTEFIDSVLAAFLLLHRIPFPEPRQG